MTTLPNCFRCREQPCGCGDRQTVYSDWHGCYDDSWKATGLLVDEAYAHPAKFSYGLIARIIAHGLDRGYWKPGDVIGDCFAGVACGGLVAAFRGLRWVGVELEPRFVELANRNIERNRRKLEAAGDPMPVVVQGDSRRFAEIVGECGAVVTSPPFVDCLHQSDKTMLAPHQQAKYGRNESAASVKAHPYGHTPGQIGNDSAETYWQAVAQVYAQCRLALKPGGCLVVVVKDYVKAGKRVPLCDDTARLLESLGFDVFERTRAWLVKHDEYPSLFGGVVRRKKERKSFFRRLAEKKGSPPIDYEEVIWARP